MEIGSLHKYHFAEKFEEIERCVNQMNNYSLITVTFVLRYLLFDSPPLLDILNHEKRYPITFRVFNDNQYKISEDEKISSLMFWTEINPQTFSAYVDLKKSSFLSHICLYVSGKKITIQEMIQFYAYCRGGIHAQESDEARFTELKIAFDIIKINGLSQLDHSMRGIVQVVYTTLKQYKEQLLS